MSSFMDKYCKTSASFSNILFFDIFPQIFCNNQIFNVKCLKVTMINFQIGHNHLNGFLPCF